MEFRHDDSDDSNIFWPGYVDATTNLVLNLLFLLTIMIVAVFMFALELGRTSKVVAAQPKVDKVMADSREVARKAEIARKENRRLKAEVIRLKKLLARTKEKTEKEKRPKVKPIKVVDAGQALKKPAKGLDTATASELGIMVRFRDGTVSLSREERRKLLKTLQPVVDSGRARLYVAVPAGFSAARRLGFYRAMAVRNLLLEMKMDGRAIDVSVVEKRSGADPLLVEVRPGGP